MKTLHLISPLLIRVRKTIFVPDLVNLVKLGPKLAFLVVFNDRPAREGPPARPLRAAGPVLGHFGPKWAKNGGFWK